MDPVIMHSLPAEQLWPAMERRYGPNPSLVRRVTHCLQRNAARSTNMAEPASAWEAPESAP